MQYTPRPDTRNTSKGVTPNKAIKRGSTKPVIRKTQGR